MLNFFKNFRDDEDGAVSVDFVVLTAAIVLLGLFVGSVIGNAAKDLSNDIAAEIEAIEINE